MRSGCRRPSRPPPSPRRHTPAGVLIVVRHSIDADTRLDAEVQVGGRLGLDRSRRHADARPARPARRVGRAPAARPGRARSSRGGTAPRRSEIATDALGVLANRRVTDCALAPDPMAALRAARRGLRPRRHRPRLDPRDAVALAAGLGARRHRQRRRLRARSARRPATRARRCSPAGSARGSGSTQSYDETGGPGITAAEIVMRRSRRRGLRDHDRAARRCVGDASPAATRTPRVLPLPRRELGDLLAEELRRMDPDRCLRRGAAATATGVAIDEQPRSRVLVWRDPALAQT